MVRGVNQGVLRLSIAQETVHTNCSLDVSSRPPSNSQSKVGQGLSPTPLLNPTTLLSATLFGAIQESQLNTDRAWKMNPGKKNHLASAKSPGHSHEHGPKGQEEHLVPRPSVDPAEWSIDGLVLFGMERLV